MVDDIIELLDNYNFNRKEKEEFFSFIIPIISHNEFVKRYSALEYPHHDNISLGYHILSDAMVTYKIIKDNPKYKDLNLKTAVIIAMFHDLYELPWQNNPNKKSSFTNKHGFVHPIEAAINAITWYPEYFENKETARIILDGIIHHMYPFPVKGAVKNIETLELNNINKYKLLLPKYKNMIIELSNRKKIFNLSFSRSIYKEGRIVSKADKQVSLSKELKSINSLQSLITGRLRYK